MVFNKSEYCTYYNKKDNKKTGQLQNSWSSITTKLFDFYNLYRVIYDEVSTSYPWSPQHFCKLMIIITVQYP